MAISKKKMKSLHNTRHEERSTGSVKYKLLSLLRKSTTWTNTSNNTKKDTLLTVVWWRKSVAVNLLAYLRTNDVTVTVSWSTLLDFVVNLRLKRFYTGSLPSAQSSVRRLVWLVFIQQKWKPSEGFFCVFCYWTKIHHSEVVLFDDIISRSYSMIS